MVELQQPETSRNQLRRISEGDNQHLERGSPLTLLQESKVLVLYTGGFFWIILNLKCKILGTIGMKCCGEGGYFE